MISSAAEIVTTDLIYIHKTLTTVYVEMFKWRRLRESDELTGHCPATGKGTVKLRASGRVPRRIASNLATNASAYLDIHRSPSLLSLFRVPINLSP